MMTAYLSLQVLKWIKGDENDIIKIPRWAAYMQGTFAGLREGD